MPKRRIGTRSAAQVAAQKKAALASAAKRRKKAVVGSENKRLIQARGEYRTNTSTAKKVPLKKVAHLQVKIGKAKKAGDAKGVKRLTAQQRAGQRDTSHGGYVSYVKYKEKTASISTMRKRKKK